MKAPLTHFYLYRKLGIKTINIKSIDPCFLKEYQISDCQSIKELNGFTKALNSRDFYIEHNMIPFLNDCKGIEKCDSLENVKLTGDGGSGLFNALIDHMIYEYQKVDASNFKGSMKWASRNNYYYQYFDLSNMNIKQVTNLKSFFIQNLNLRRVKGIETINFSNVTDMNSMFSDCHRLLDIDGFQNIKIADNTEVQCLFESCIRLWEYEDVDLTNIKNCKPCYAYMFTNCSFKSLNLSGWEIPTKFEHIEGPYGGHKGYLGFDSMFKGFKGEKLILHGWNLARNQDGINSIAYDDMFKDCTNLKEIDLGTTTHANLLIWLQLLKKFNLSSDILKYTPIEI